MDMPFSGLSRQNKRMGHRPRARIWELYLDGHILLSACLPVKGWRQLNQDAPVLENLSSFNKLSLHQGTKLRIE
jgi:hypothetical protein